jgi:hypothetical protein
MDIDAEVKEAFEERAAIMEFDGGLPREDAERAAESWAAQYLHECEVRLIVAMYRDHGSDAVKEVLASIGEKRGAEAMQRLRADALKVLAEQGRKRG